MDFILEDEEFFYLYKHLGDFSGALNIITEGTIQFTNPQKFNDPLDCFFGVKDDDFFSTAEEIKDLYERHNHIRPDGKPYTDIELKEHADYLRVEETKKIHSGEYQRELHSNVGICSLNQNPLNILMWSHYANSHKGFMVEFQFPKLTVGESVYENFTPLPIIYSEEFPLLSKADNQTHKGVEKIFLTKSIDWTYEKEQRVVDTDRGSGIHLYPRELILKSVIAGMGISVPDFDLLKEAVLKATHEIGRDILLYQSKRLNNQYALTVEGHPRLDVQNMKRS